HVLFFHFSLEGLFRKPSQGLAGFRRYLTFSPSISMRPWESNSLNMGSTIPALLLAQFPKYALSFATFFGLNFSSLPIKCTKKDSKPGRVGFLAKTISEMLSIRPHSICLEFM